MKKRPLPLHCNIYLKIAQKAKLQCPLGRALYAVNRIHNGGYPWSSMIAADMDPVRSKAMGIYNFPEDQIIAKLKTIQPETAKRWLAHWKAGNSIKSLSHGKAGRIRTPRSKEEK